VSVELPVTGSFWLDKELDILLLCLSVGTVGTATTGMVETNIIDHM